MRISSSREYRRHNEVALLRSAPSGLVMFVSYFLAGLIPLLPYVVLREVTSALRVSILLSLFALFILGLLTARLTKTGQLKEGLQIVLLGGAAVLLGVFIGRFVQVIK